VTEAEFYRARQALQGRQVGSKGVGRAGDAVANLFQGLLCDARDGSLLHILDKGSGWRYLASSASLRRERGAVRAPFPYAPFEKAVLSLLREIDPGEVLGRLQASDDVLVLSGKLTAVEAAIARIEAEMAEHGESPTLFRRLRAREDEQRDLAAKLAAARASVATPMAESWGEFKSLLDVLAKAPDPKDARLRLRAALRRVVKSAHVLVVKKGADRLAAVQLRFNRSEAVRSYFIAHRPATANRHKRTEGKTWAVSLSEVARPGDLDLRLREHARALEAALAAVDLGDLEDG
jgi:hypothetical protein